MRILVSMPKGPTRDSFIGPNEAKRLEALGTVIWNETDKNWSEDELCAHIPDVDILVTGWGFCSVSEKVLLHANALRCIAHTGGSVANLATEAVYDRGIAVISGNDLYARSVAESVIAYALYMLRDMGVYNAQMLECGWSKPGWYTEGLLDQTVGLIGFGAVARHTARLLQAFGTKTMIYADHVTPEEAASYGAKKATLNEILTTCKVISLHMAKTPETYHFLGKKEFELISDNALFINTARGAIIDEQALIAELSRGRFRAVLDVYEVEPPPMDSPLRMLPNVFLMPHMAGPTVDRRPFVTQALAGAIPDALLGKETALTITREMMRRMTI